MPHPSIRRIKCTRFNFHGLLQQLGGSYAGCLGRESTTKISMAAEARGERVAVGKEAEREAGRAAGRERAVIVMAAVHAKEVLVGPKNSSWTPCNASME